MNELAMTATVLVAIGLIGLLGMAGVFAAPWSRTGGNAGGKAGGSWPQPIPVPVRAGDPNAELFRILGDATRPNNTSRNGETHGRYRR